MPRPGYSFRIHGARELENALKQLPKAVGKSVVRQALVRSAAPVVTEAAALAPVGETGRLRASITAKTTLTKSQRRGRQKAGDVEAFVGSTDPKSHLLEFGTVNMPAQPFMRPAWDAKKDQVLHSIGQEMWKALAKAAKRLAKQASTGKLSKASTKFFQGR